MRKNTLILLVAVSVFTTSGCFWPGTLHADGWLPRTVRVVVTDGETGDRIEDARVRLIPADDMQKFLDQHKNEHSYEGTTDASGVAELTAWFGFGSMRTFWHKEGHFGLASVRSVKAAADGYASSEQSFIALTGERTRSIKNKSPIKIIVVLKRIGEE